MINFNYAKYKLLESVKEEEKDLYVRFMSVVKAMLEYECNDRMTTQQVIDEFELIKNELA